jgi:threonine dehydratase
MAQQKFPTLQEFEQAAARVASVVSKTPLIESHWLSAFTGQNVFFKCENLQRTGAYKVRGAYNLISQLTPEEKKRGVVAASTGHQSHHIHACRCITT